MTNKVPIGAHLVGSIPAETAEQAFRLVADHMIDHVTRLPDGEVGERDTWIRWQYGRIGKSEQLELSTKDPVYVPVRPFRVRDGVRAHDDISFPDLGYARAAVESYAVFADLVDKGVVPDRMRFQVGLPTPLSVSLLYVEASSRARFERGYENALLAEIATICDRIPPEKLAIQWETVSEFALLEGMIDSHIEGDLEDEICTRVARVVGSVPAAVEVGLHLCYGDSGHKHFCEPVDTTYLANICRGVLDKSLRPLHWIHLPVPRNRHDDAYFAPLAGLAIPAPTRLFLGLVHHTDGEAGTARRIAAASRFVGDFGIATECGLGRRPPETIPGLMRQHARLAQPVNSL